MVCDYTECFRFLFHIGFVPRLWLSVLAHIRRPILLSTRLTMALNHEAFKGVYFQHSGEELLRAIVLLSGRLLVSSVYRLESMALRNSTVNSGGDNNVIFRKYALSFSLIRRTISALLSRHELIPGSI